MKVKFVPSNTEVEIQSGQTVMDVAHKNGIAIRSTCNGMPSCAECRVRVVEGDWNCNPPSREELNLIGTGYYIDQRRLSCQLLCFGDVTVDTTEQVEKSAEGPVTKKFLTRVHKNSPQESHSLGGVLIEQDGQLLQELKKDVVDDGGGNFTGGLEMDASSGAGGSGIRREGGRMDRGRQQNNDGPRRDNGHRSDGGGGRRRRRGRRR